MKKELALIPSKYFNCSPVSLEIAKNTPVEEWLRIGELLKKTNVATQWWLGDWYNFGIENMPEEISQALNPDKYDEGTLRQYGWVAKRINPVTRVTNLPFSIQREVAKLENREQIKWLKK